MVTKYESWNDVYGRGGVMWLSMGLSLGASLRPHRGYHVAIIDERCHIGRLSRAKAMKTPWTSIEQVTHGAWTRDAGHSHNKQSNKARRTNRQTNEEAMSDLF